MTLPEEFSRYKNLVLIRIVFFRDYIILFF